MLLHNKIFCNDIIFHWRKVNLQICEIYNGREKQTITHLLYSCPTVKHIWRLLEDWCSELDLPCEVNFVNILYNLIQPKPEHVVNFITLFAKHYLFYAKCMLYCNTEMHIAVKNGI